MTAQPITVESFTKAIREVVAELGEDYVYPKDQPGFSVPNYYTTSIAGSPTVCVYKNTLTGEPACIVGRVVAKLGYAIDGHNGGAEAFLRNLDKNTPYEVQEAARAAQTCQDDGGRYGRALGFYIETLEGLGALVPA